MAQAPRSRVDELKTQTEYPNGSGNGPLPRITARNPAMVMVMMLLVMKLWFQCLRLCWWLNLVLLLLLALLMELFLALDWCYSVSVQECQN